MYNKIKPFKTTLNVQKQFQGETIEKKVNRILTNKEPIKDGAPRIYTERKDGINPDMNIRTDRWEHAVEGRDYITRSHLAKRNSTIGDKAQEGMNKESKTETKNETGGQSAQGTDK